VEQSCQKAGDFEAPKTAGTVASEKGETHTGRQKEKQKVELK
jgi:hypothetical protein